MFAALKKAGTAAVGTAATTAIPQVKTAAKGAKPGGIAGIQAQAAAIAKAKAEDAALVATLGADKAAAAKSLQAATGTGTSGILGSMKTFFGETLPNAAKATGTWFVQGLNPLDPTATWWHRFFAFLPFILIAIGLFIYFGIKRGLFSWMSTRAKNVAENVGNRLSSLTASAPKPVKEKFVDATPVSADKYTLVNLQPRTIKQAAFIGPLPEGSFDTTGTAQALRGGFRSFIFQIDYLDTNRGDKFAAPGIPALLYRGDDGALLSTNSADINEVAQTIANLAFRPEVPNYTEPLIIYLHILRTPSVIRDPEGYKTFLSKIATALNPLAPNHLGMTPLGSFNRQKQESALINTPLNTFEGQVIILCNADTTIFRTAKGVDPANDLDFWVNIRVYLSSSTDSFGVTQAPPAGTTPSAVVVGLSSLLGLSSQKADAFASQAKSQFVIALPSQLKNPTADEVDKAINTLGVNIVPIDIFSDAIEKTDALVAEYSNMTFRPKPAGLRNA